MKLTEVAERSDDMKALHQLVMDFTKKIHMPFKKLGPRSFKAGNTHFLRVILYPDVHKLHISRSIDKDAARNVGALMAGEKVTEADAEWHALQWMTKFLDEWAAPRGYRVQHENPATTSKFVTSWWSIQL